MKKKKIKKQRQFGLIGRNISYSFSKKYFTDKFEQNFFDNCNYANYDLESLREFPKLIENTKGLVGLNVTIPYKEAILPYLDKISKKAKKIGAVNCITVSKKKKLKGYNTDYYGFKKSLQPLLKKHHTKALILGTGGASKAVAFALKKLNIEFDFVSRNPNEYEFSYEDLNAEVFSEYTIIVNTTPVGTYPNINDCPSLDYTLFTAQHIAFDLIYNPEKTTFLKKAKAHGATIKNGYEMLVFQAEKGWEIWNK
ncbi:Shikimate dehydrogenase [Flavobacterium indicum GPTSA100-9 = DSM 17447]|uniref:Shikimate dehydrogenase n=1 Tax=Flavobacterium indicum (strain DSM 17447 / CIP 109464 / GPTSA100-9) TaxID=1094466 RepID=H8XV26_FLAIG|nr:shikimate dehydrogenase [Flavobacterium indicum]CCG52996.1 Shikimate dehydrogenase [Flavobacterium indicum GPTSA100-9 = DSM 17447]